jgi:hypothetical protein
MHIWENEFSQLNWWFVTLNLDAYSICFPECMCAICYFLVSLWCLMRVCTEQPHLAWFSVAGVWVWWFGYALIIDTNQMMLKTYKQLLFDKVLWFLMNDCCYAFLGIDLVCSYPKYDVYLIPAPRWSIYDVDVDLDLLLVWLHLLLAPAWSCSRIPLCWFLVGW